MDNLENNSLDNGQSCLQSSKETPALFVENVVCFDIDQTLVIWGAAEEDCNVSFICPHSRVLEHGVAHDEHVQRVKRHNKDGHFVIAWSAGGGEYAYNAIVALGLKDYVNLCLDKPMQYYDDIDAHEFMGRRTYLEGGHKPGEYKPRSDYCSDWSDR